MNSKAARDTLAEADPKRALYEEEIRRAWRLYEARNRELAHLAANLLLLFAQVWGCSLICGESLKTLKTTGRGRGVRGRWRNYRNNTTIRGDIERILRYKCHLLGMRFHSERPRGTSHTCPQVPSLRAPIDPPVPSIAQNRSSGVAGWRVPTADTMPTATAARHSTSPVWASPSSRQCKPQAKEKPSP